MSCIEIFKAEFSPENLNLDRKTSRGIVLWVDAFGHDSNRCIGSWEGFLAFRIFNALCVAQNLVTNQRLIMTSRADS